MTNAVVLRTGMDRLRYSVSFEFSLMLVLIPAGALFFGRGLAEIGLLAVILSGKAMVINLIYNWGFDRFDARAGRVSSDRGVVGRILHAVGFEMVLLVTSMPIYMWWLGLTLVQTAATDLVVTSFVVGYTYVFTLGYDRLFPVRVVVGHR